MTTSRLSSLCGLCISLMTILAVSAVVVGIERHSPLHESAPTKPVSTDETLGSPITSYQSDSFDYGIRIPSDWTADLSRSAVSGDIYTDPTGTITITVGAMMDERASVSDGDHQIADTIQAARLLDPRLMVHLVRRMEWKDHPSVMVRTTSRVGEETMESREYHVLRPEIGDVLSVTVSANENCDYTVQKTIEEIMESLDVHA